jgi:hypothetical protein
LLKKNGYRKSILSFFLHLLLQPSNTKHGRHNWEEINILFVHYFLPLPLSNGSLQIFGEVYLFFVQRFVVGDADERDGAFGERVLVVPASNRESLPVVTERLEHDDSLPETVVKLLTGAVALRPGLGRRCPVTGNAFSAGLDDVAGESDVDLALLVDLDEIASADLYKVFLKFERVQRPVGLADAQHANVSSRRSRSEI